MWLHPERPALVNHFVTFLLDCTFGKMTLPRLKCSIPAGFCKSNRRQSLFQGKPCILGQYIIFFRIRTRKCAKLFTENITEYFAHVQAVCTRHLLGGGPGDEANNETSASTRFRSAGEIKSSQELNLGLLIGKNIYAQLLFNSQAGSHWQIFYIYSEY